jgi:hypothetical protein
VQRFLSSPHHIRMHYGHPDMTNAHMMRRTAGVSRGSLRVNVNEDIFLGYEMVLQGVDIIFTEWLFYGKGRDVEFNAASVFLKKLAQGCVMQLASRQVCDLYLTELTCAQKFALFYGTINHFIIIWISDHSVVAFTSMWVLFQLADITPPDLGMHGSLAGIPWIIPLGILNALPMLVERRIEYTYLSWSDIILSIPFFSHQNRITSHLFSLALQTQTGAYMASGRGLGNTATSLVEIFNYHAITNFIPGGKLILLVIFYCFSGGDVLYLLWPLIAGICYICAPVMYNPKPSYKEVMESVSQLFVWVFAKDETFDDTGYRMIAESKVPLDVATKEKIFGAGGDMGSINERQKFAQDWEKALKGGAMKKSLQSFWAFHWFEYLNNLDGDYNDPMSDSLFLELFWKPLTNPANEDMQLDFAEEKERWDRDGYSVTYGTLSSFLSDYCRMGMIKLDPEPENGDPVLILGNPEGPDASMLQSGWHIRRTSPDSELIKLQIKIAIKYIFWLMMPIYTFLRRRQYDPYDYLHDMSWWAVATVLYTVLYKVLKYVSQWMADVHRSVLPDMALKCLGLIIFIILIFRCIFNSDTFLQAFALFFILGILIAWGTEVAAYGYHWHMRRKLPRMINRSFGRLGFLMRLSRSPIRQLYQLMFIIIGLGLVAFQFVLVILQYLHTMWMFNRHVAQLTNGF